MPMKSHSDGRYLDEIHLQDLKVHCTIGIHPDEATRTQLLRLNLILYLDTRAAASSGRLQQSVDYSALARELSFVLMHGRFRLLESAAEALASYVLAPAPSDKPHARIEGVELQITKPEALGGTALPAIKIVRESPLAIDLSCHTRQAASSPKSQLIFAAPEAALWRFTVGPHEAIPLDVEGWQAKAILPQSSHLSFAGQALRAGEHFDLATLELKGGFLKNESQVTRSLLLLAERPRACLRPSRERGAEL